MTGLPTAHVLESVPKAEGKNGKSAAICQPTRKTENALARDKQSNS
jgi:hypothetical protein